MTSIVLTWIEIKYFLGDIISYHIYPNKSRAHINAWARINAEVQHCKVNRCPYIQNVERAYINAWSIIVYNTWASIQINTVYNKFFMHHLLLVQRHNCTYVASTTVYQKTAVSQLLTIS